MVLGGLLHGCALPENQMSPCGVTPGQGMLLVATTRQQGVYGPRRARRRTAKVMSCRLDLVSWRLVVRLPVFVTCRPWCSWRVHTMGGYKVIELLLSGTQLFVLIVYELVLMVNVFVEVCWQASLCSLLTLLFGLKT